MKNNKSCLLLLILIILMLCGFCSGYLLLTKVMGITHLPVYHLGQPAPTERDLFDGVHYQRIVTNDPRPLVIHIVTVDMEATGTSFLVTPPVDTGTEHPLFAQTTSQFLQRSGVELAINGDGFTPWYSRGLLGYYPHSGDVVTPNGYAMGNGQSYGPAVSQNPTLYFSENNIRASILQLPSGQVQNAITGDFLLIRNTRIEGGLDNTALNPRTAIGINLYGNRLTIIVVDGRQEGYSEGVTLQELAELFLEHNITYAMSLDGGGSSTLVVRNAFGLPELLNTPVHQGIPGNERPVGNHLGIHARPIE